ncbi:isopeptide-forming domain-containing fimbrial protein [Microbacterium sp.]|uniref:isopeptide-forming domain-containing fimbrial protein n=1 Tax=Microbacterium sp. TaxID=51671 RepID=UPI0039E6A394
MHYTLTGVNTGETRLDEVVISDDLSGVLDHATFNDDVAVTVGGREVAAPSLAGTTLTWSGALAEGETVMITYSVTVKTGVTGATLRNVATSTATPPGGETITPPPSATDNEVEILAVSGGQFPLWLPVLALLLLIGGGALLLRRRSATE